MTLTYAIYHSRMYRNLLREIRGGILGGKNLRANDKLRIVEPLFDDRIDTLNQGNFITERFKCSPFEDILENYAKKASVEDSSYEKWLIELYRSKKRLGSRSYLITRSDLVALVRETFQNSPLDPERNFSDILAGITAIHTLKTTSQTTTVAKMQGLKLEVTSSLVMNDAQHTNLLTRVRIAHLPSAKPRKFVILGLEWKLLEKKCSDNYSWSRKLDFRDDEDTETRTVVKCPDSVFQCTSLMEIPMDGRYIGGSVIILDEHGDRQSELAIPLPKFRLQL